MNPEILQLCIEPGHEARASWLRAALSGLLPGNVVTVVPGSLQYDYTSKIHRVG